MLDRRLFLKGGLALGSIAYHKRASAAQAVGAYELPRLGLSDASRLIQTRQISCIDLTTAYLHRIKVIEPKLNAFITVAAEEALARARLLDAETAAGKLRGPLHGLPIVLKDNIDTQSIRTTAGSQIFDDRVPQRDAFVVDLLTRAGVVILGKANMHEFAMGRTSATSYFGPVHNPWALDRVPAGSSGGCAAAVIADLCAAAVGTDTGGSARMPAAYCGIVGLKPTYGLVSTRGIVPLVYSMDHCGPMTKSVEDSAMLLSAMVSYDNEDVASVDRLPVDYVEQMRQPVRQFRLGIPRAPFFDKLDPQIEQVVNAAIDLLANMSAGAKDVTMPATNGLDLSEGSALNAEMLSVHEEMLRYEASGYSISIRRRLQEKQKELDSTVGETGSEKVIAYIKASWELARTRKTIDAAFSDFDLLVLPTMRLLPPKISDVLERDETTAPKAREPERDNNCAAFNIWGIPAISIPCGFSKEGWPIGLMIAGPRFSEGKILALAHAYEQATQWHTRRPAL